MANFYVQKVTALPAVLAANTMYMVTDADANFLELYVSNSAGTAQRRIPTKTDIETWIATALAGVGTTQVVASIAARDALVGLSVGSLVWATDATADPTVVAGAASYLWDGAAFQKLSEAESLDVIVDWADVTNKPTSAVAAIDQAVTDSHTHANKAVLDLVTLDADGDLQYNGNPLRISWDATDW